MKTPASCTGAMGEQQEIAKAVTADYDGSKIIGSHVDMGGGEMEMPPGLIPEGAGWATVRLTVDNAHLNSRGVGMTTPCNLDHGIETIVLHECTVLGGYGYALPNAASVRLEFGDELVGIMLDDGRTIWISYLEVAEIAISGPGSVTSGGGFAGGGFGVEEALEGIAAATVLNALTTRSTIHTFLSITTHIGELHFHYAGMEPGALRIALAMPFSVLRRLDQTWLQERLGRLEAFRDRSPDSHFDIERLRQRLLSPQALDAPLRSSIASDRPLSLGDRPVNRSLVSDEYQLYLIRKYRIEKSGVLGKFVVMHKLFVSMEEALRFADSLDIADEQHARTQLADRARIAVGDADRSRLAELEAQQRGAAGRHTPPRQAQGEALVHIDALNVAIAKGNIAGVRQHLVPGLNVSESNRWGLTPLLCATQHERKAILELLHEHQKQQGFG